MLRITFKNVGQGDSIILEWEDEKGDMKLGVIDCNIVTNEGLNPVLDFVKASSYREIDFILLTHPHYDHFSGMIQLLEYCEQSQISIGMFMLTAFSMPAYVKSSVRTIEAKKELNRIFKKVKELCYAKKNITREGYVSDTMRDYALGKDISMRFLAPSPKEINKFNRNIALKADQEDTTNSAIANWLATVIKISGEGWHVLLTSDVEGEALKRIWHERSEDFANSSLLLAQCPHHGASANHNSKFWKRVKGMNSNPSLVISVGKNSYGHPSKKVISDFEGMDYNIYSTNQVGGFEDVSKETMEVSALLDIVSFEIPITQKGELSGDQVFTIKNGVLTYH